jgi:hypothetical protein
MKLLWLKQKQAIIYLNVFKFVLSFISLEKTRTTLQRTEEPSMAQEEKGTPSRECRLDTTCQTPGSRSERYAELFRRTDPLADAVMDEFARMPEGDWRAMLDRALTQGIEAVPDAPAAGAYVETKFGSNGTYRAGIRQSSWRHPDACAAKIPAPSAAAVEAAMAYSDYIYRCYERFPAYAAPFRTLIGFQVCRVDVDFYRQFYENDSLPETVLASTRRALDSGLSQT